MRLVMMGTGPFAVPIFESLFTTAHEVALLVTQPARAGRGKRKPPENPIRAVATAHQTPVFDPDDVNTESAGRTLSELGADLFVVADYGQILSKETLSLASQGGINLHASLLPKYRGAAPVNWAIYHGEASTGVTVIQMTPQLDAGPAVERRSLAIGPAETAAELEPRLAELAAELTVEVLEKIAHGSLEPLPQDNSQATRARRLRKSDGLVDWNRSARQLVDQVRAFTPWPKTYTFWHPMSGEPVRWILGQVFESGASDQEVATPLSTAAPGTVVKVAEDGITVGCGAAQLVIASLQPAGKRMMPVAEFLRGHRVCVGDRLGGES